MASACALRDLTGTLPFDDAPWQYAGRDRAERSSACRLLTSSPIRRRWLAEPEHAESAREDQLRCLTVWTTVCASWPTGRLPAQGVGREHMALTSCNGCGSQVSTNAVNCPKCGHQVQVRGGINLKTRSLGQGLESVCVDGRRDSVLCLPLPALALARFSSRPFFRRISAMCSAASRVLRSCSLATPKTAEGLVDPVDLRRRLLLVGSRPGASSKPTLMIPQALMTSRARTGSRAAWSTSAWRGSRSCCSRSRRRPCSAASDRLVVERRGRRAGRVDVAGHRLVALVGTTSKPVLLVELRDAFGVDVADAHVGARSGPARPSPADRAHALQQDALPLKSSEPTPRAATARVPARNHGGIGAGVARAPDAARAPRPSASRCAPSRVGDPDFMSSP